MTDSAVRGAILDVVKDPWLHPQEDCARFWADAVIQCRQGKIESIEPFQEDRHSGLPIEHYPGALIVPGFVDCHLHYAQTRVIGAYGNQLLEWLQTYVFPEEIKFRDKSYADEVAHQFFDLLLAQGTTTVQSFATTSAHSVEAFFEEAARRQVRAITGLTGIDREGTAPEEYRDTPDSFYEGSAALIERFHGQGRNLYSICPRFALGSTEAQMNRAGQLKSEYPDCWVNTHLSENPVEIETVLGFFPDDRDYLAVYERFGLVGPRFSAGHSIHLSLDEFERMAGAGAAITFCPASNLFLGSGLFRIDRCKEYGVRLGLGCDSGAGNTLSMLRTLDDAYKVGMLQFVQDPDERFKVSALRGLYLATLGSAHSLYLDHLVGTLEQGKEADFVVLEPSGSPTLAARNGAVKPVDLETACYLFFGMMMLYDERVVRATYVHGRRRHII